MALFDSAIGGCYCCVSFSPRVDWICLFFLLYEGDQDERETEPNFPSVSIQLSRVEWQQQAILVSARASWEGVKYIEMLASCIDVIQLSALVLYGNLTCFQCCLCCRADDSRQRHVKCLTVLKLHSRGSKRRRTSDTFSLLTYLLKSWYFYMLANCTAQ